VRVCHHFIMLVVCMSSFSTPWILSGLENWGLSRIFWTYSSHPYILICCYRFLIWGPLSTRLLGSTATGRLLTERMEGTCQALQYVNGMFWSFFWNIHLEDVFLLVLSQEFESDTGLYGPYIVSKPIYIGQINSCLWRVNHIRFI
jgi:hypothetical protein